MFEAMLYASYYLLSFFYMLCGVLLITHPHFIIKFIQSFFPVLESFKYRRVTNGINLIVVGLLLLWIGDLIVETNIVGFWLALIISSLEIYLGITYYYFEAKDVAQAIIHLGVHIIVVIALIIFMLSTFPRQIQEAQEFTGAIILSLQ